MAKRDNKTVVFQKIPLRDLIETLQSVYNQGADYIDISGTPNEEQDVIGIHVLEEYLMNEDEEEDGNDELSEDDLSKLL
jgi:3-dehydroquinate dehydratase